MKKLRYAITGANGFVGSHIVRYLIDKRCEVYEIGRHPSKKIQRKSYFIYHSLGGAINQKKLHGIDVFIHCAYDFSLIKWGDIKKINIDGSVNLLEEASNAGVKKMILISTMSAFEGCKSLYGKAKISIEREASKLGAIIVRPGLVFGKNVGGMIGSLNKMISISKFIPLVSGGNQLLHLCHYEDLAHLVWELSIGKKKINIPIVAASEKGLTSKEILKILSEIKYKKNFPVSIPYWIIFSCFKLLELMHIKMRLSSDSLVSLVNLNQNINFDETRKCGVSFREFNIRTANG